MNHSHLSRTFGFTLLLASASAHGAVLFQSNGSNISGFVGTTNTPNADGGVVATTTPFSINGVSQGSYLAVSNYTWSAITSISAASAGNQEIWVGFLISRDNRDSWAGGISVGSGTLPAQNSPGVPGGQNFAGGIGWNSDNVANNTSTITLMDGTQVQGGGAGSGAQALATNGQIALLARFYENAGSGLFDRGDVYYDTNLSNGISFGAAAASGVNMSSGADATINAIRLDANGNAETRYYDNIVVATTQAEALGLIPEPSTALLCGLGVLALLRRSRN